MNKKVVAIIIFLLMVSTVPLAAGITQDRDPSPNPDIVGRLWLRGFMFRRIKSGHINNAIAIRMHYIEITPTERTWGVITMKRIAFRDFLYIGRFYETPLGVLGYVCGFFRGGLEVY